MLKLRRGGTKAKTSRVVAALDIGTSKVCCLIMAVDGPEEMRLVGFGHQRMRGLKAGVVVDPDQAERAVRAAVGQAERMAGHTLERVFVSVTCGRLKSSNFVARAPLADGSVGRGDIARVFAAGDAFAARNGRVVVQLMHGDWSLDGQPAVRDPLGMAGRELSLPMHAVTADEPPLRNLLHVVERCYLEAEGLVAAPFASALAATTEEERHLGVLCIDFGGGTTTLSIFVDGRSVFVDSVPVGGSHVSYDIARAFSTPLAEAERIKALYGTLVQAHSDESEVIAFQSADNGVEAPFQATKAQLRAVIEARLEALYGLVAERLAQSGVEHVVGNRVVVTGGASQLVGLAEWWSARCGSVARTGRPRILESLSSAMSSPAFSAAVGLVLAGMSPEAGSETSGGALSAPAGSSYLGRIHGWIRDSF
jgi:cell division protein FtsA